MSPIFSIGRRSLVIPEAVSPMASARSIRLMRPPSAFERAERIRKSAHPSPPSRASIRRERLVSICESEMRNESVLEIGFIYLIISWLIKYIGSYYGVKRLFFTFSIHSHSISLCIITLTLFRIRRNISSKSASGNIYLHFRKNSFSRNHTC